VAERTLNENQMKVQIGTMAPIDVVQTRSEVASRREQLVTATFSITQTEDQIKKLISSENDPTLFLTRLTAMELPRQPSTVTIPDLNEAVRSALENRPEVRQAQLDLQNRDIDVKYTKNQKLPIFDIIASYSQNGTGGRRTDRGNVIGGEIRNIIPGGIADAFGQLFSYDYSGYSVGFSLTIPLSNKAADADYERAVTEQRLSESRISSLTQQIALEVRNALTQVEMNRARIETAQVSRELAQQRMEAEQTKFNLGTSTLRFVLEEQRNVAQAETNELQALVNFTKSLVDLDRAMGMTLNRNNVEIEKAVEPATVARSVMEPSGAN
jgi:outer membrane protein TolC